MSAQPSEQIQHGDLPTLQDQPAEVIIPPKPERTANGRIFGTFWLDGTEFALDIDVFREAVKEPAAISVVPLSPPYMRGLFNLRGTIIPIVDLRRLLEIPEGPTKDRRVAIVDDGNICIGLLVDRTGQVLTIKDEHRVDLAARSDQQKDVVVQGFLKLDGGNRIVQILDPREVLDLKKVPRGETLWGNGSRLMQNRRRGRFNCLSFQFGHTTCAIDLRHVVEVRHAPDINESVLVHDCFIGITQHRGEIMPVADFRNFMGDEARLRSSKDVKPLRKMLVVQTDGGMVGLLVYSVDSIITSFEDEILPFTKLAIPRGDIVRGCIVGKNEQIIMLLDYEALKAVPILVETAQRCREVHQQADETRKAAKKKEMGARLTFIVFMLDRPLALDSRQVSEVIKYPPSLLRPPYTLNFVEGVLDLRGDMIPVIDPRRVYDLPGRPATEKRIIVLRHEDRRYGLVVDAVEEITRTTADQIRANMSARQSNSEQSLGVDDGRCIKSAKHGPVMTMDGAAFMQRCFRMAEGKDF